MPATFPSHQGLVLPLKLWRPRWFDGVGLTAGAAAPDAGYLVIGLIALPETHTVGALVWFALPVAYLGCLVIRRAAPVVAAHLPAGGVLHLRDYGVLGLVRHPWYVTTSSILLGAATHLFWDGFTHAPYGTHGWATAAWPVLDADNLFGRPWWWSLQWVLSAAGAVVWVLLLWQIGRTRALVRWHGHPPEVPRAQGAFWASAAAVLVAALVALPLLPRAASLHVTGVRILYTVALALLGGAAVTAIVTRAARTLPMSPTGSTHGVHSGRVSWRACQRPSRPTRDSSCR